MEWDNAVDLLIAVIAGGALVAIWRTFWPTKDAQMQAQVTAGAAATAAQAARAQTEEEATTAFRKDLLENIERLRVRVALVEKNEEEWRERYHKLYEEHSVLKAQYEVLQVEVAQLRERLCNLPGGNMKAGESR